MSRLYLITGFLGAGKTSFLKNFIRLFAGSKIQLIVNEFGQEGVDGVLLAELGAYIEEISGGSVFCSCRFDRFEMVLAQTAKKDSDIILVEASGLSDPTGVRKLFSLEDRFPDIEYMGAICLVDAVRFYKLYSTARTCVKQLAASDVAVVNKIDIATEEEVEKTIEIISGQRPDMPVIRTSYGVVEPEILDVLKAAVKNPDGSMPLTADLTLRSMLITIKPTIMPYELKKFIEMFSESAFRVKGFIKTTDGVFLADCIGNVVNLVPFEGELSEEKIGRLVVLSGAGMPIKKHVDTAAEWYKEHIEYVKQSS